METTERDLVLREIGRTRDKLSAVRGHRTDRLLAEARERQDHSGHPVVNLPT